MPVDKKNLNKNHLSHLFEGFQSTFFPQFCDVVQYKLLDFSHVAENGEAPEKTPDFRILFDEFFIGYNYSNDA
jgi:hypothetical protein